MKIVAIYQSNGKTIDNLTVITDDRDIFRGTVAYLGCDENGGHSFSQWGELNERDISKLSDDRTELIFSKRNHLGKLIDFTKLNRETQKHIAERILL
jgi:hypothetical protein